MKIKSEDNKKDEKEAEDEEELQKLTTQQQWYKNKFKEKSNIKNYAAIKDPTSANFTRKRAPSLALSIASSKNNRIPNNENGQAKNNK